MASKRYEAVNSNILGLNERERERGNYQLHPLIRSDWKSVDRFRDAQGYVPVLRANPQNGDLEVSVRPDLEGTINPPFLRNPLNYQYPQATTPSSPKDTRTMSIAPVVFDSESWNNANIDGPLQVNNLLNQENAGTNLAGVPYFEKYFSVNPQNLPNNNEAPYGLLTTDPRMAGATQNTLPLMAQIPGGPENPILSHKFFYDYYDPQDPGRSGPTYNIEIEPKYNLFLDTSPDYESVISSVSETLIPNFYHVEISTLLADSTADSIPTSYIPFELGGEITLSDYKSVLRGSLSGSDEPDTQTNSQGYLQFYSNNISILNTSSYAESYGNVAVLSSDISFNTLTNINTLVRDNRGTEDETDDLLVIDTYPFYNKITIPYNNQWDTTSQGQPSIIEALYDVGDEENGYNFIYGFLVTLELLILREFKLGNAQQPPTVPFTIYDTTDNNFVVANGLEVPLPVRIDAVLNDFLEGISLNGSPEPGGPYEFINDLILSGQYGLGFSDLFIGASTELGASFITAMNYEPDVAQSLSILYNVYSQWFNDLQTTHITEALNIIGNYRKDFYDIHTNQDAGIHYSEPIMYLVEKRVIPAGQASAAASEPVVQRLFFGRDIVYNEKGVVYYDTQIKYGVRYQYDIKQVRMIVGESYYYDSVVTVANSGAVGQGRALGNALGFYAEEDAAFQATETFAISTNLPSFEYTPENEDPISSPPSGQPTQGRRGNYVYKIPQTNDPAAATNIDQIFGARSDTSYTTNDPYQNSRQISETDLNLLPIQIVYGTGLDGNFTGGAIPATSLNIFNSPAPPEVPEDIQLAPVGAEEDPIGDSIFEGIEEVVASAVGQGSQDAEEQAVDQFESQFVTELGQGFVETAGGLTIDLQSGLNLAPFGAGTGNPLSEFGPGGFAGFDSLDIAQNLGNTANNIPGGASNVAGSVRNLGADLGLGQSGAGLPSQTNNIGVEVDLNLFDNLFNRGFIGP